MRSSVFMLLIFVLSASWVKDGLARDTPNAPPPAFTLPKLPPLPQWPTFPWLTSPPAHEHHKDPKHPWPPITDDDVQKCWSSLSTIETCVEAIIRAFFNLRLEFGKDCCNAITEIRADCYGKMFHHFHNPFYPLLLKEHCSHVAAPTPKA